MVGATTPNAGASSASSLAVNARASWNLQFTPSATGSLRAGDTITVTFTAGFNTANVTTVSLSPRFINCSATVTGVGTVATVVLADSGGVCVLTPSVVAITIAGVVNGSTTGAVQPTLKTSADTTAVSETASTMVAANAPTAGQAAASNLSLGARASWTTPFTTSATGALRTGDTITVTYTAGFSAANVTTATLGTGFINCSATVTGVGTVATVVLADNGGICSLPATTAASLTIAGVVNGATTGAVQPTVKTSADTTAVSETAATMVAASTPTAGQAAASNLSLGARASWTTPFTTSANGSLRTGDTITVTYTAGFSAANVTTATLGTGFINCSATVTGVGTVATVVLANSGGICSLPATTAASLTIAGVVNGATTGAVQPTVKTSADTTAVSETAATMVAASTPTAGQAAASNLSLGARASWTTPFTSSANGSLRTGDTITVTYTAGFSAANVTTATLGTGFINCSATVTGVGTVATVVLANSGGICSLPATTAASLTIAGVVNGATTGAVQPTVKTSADTTAVSETAATMVAATNPTAVTVSSTSLAAGARANWTTNFTSSANGALRTGDSITVTFSSGFNAANVTTATLGAGFVNCSATVTGVGTVATVVLADNGGTCALPASTAASLIIGGVTNTSTTGSSTETVKTSADTTATNATAVTIAALGSPTGVTVDSTSFSAGVRASWTVNFTSTAAGALRAGDKVTVTFSAGFAVPATPAISLLNGFRNCSATATGASTVATITLANSGGTCALPAATAASLAVAGVTNTSTTGSSTETVSTSADTTAASAAAVTIVGATSPTAVTVSSTSLAALARATWTVNFTPSTSGSLRASDVITISFSTGFSVPATPTIALTGGFTNCSAAATGSGSVATVTLADNGGTCLLPASAAASLTVAGVVNGSAGSSTETVKTTTDTTAANATAVTITAASTPTGVTFAGAPQTAATRSKWTVGFTSSATGALRAGDTITVGFPTGFSAPATPTVALIGGFTNCAATAATSALGVVLTLSDNGGTCAVANNAATTFTIASVTNGPAASYSSFTVKTSADTTAASPGSSVVIGAATTPTAVTISAVSLGANALTTWTIGYTTSATSGALRAGSTITVAFPIGFSVAPAPTVTLPSGYTNCSATAVGSASGSSTNNTLTVTLADSGGTCSVPVSTATTLTVNGITNTNVTGATSFNVSTSSDTTPATSGTATIATEGIPTAVTISSTSLSAGARATWTVNFTTTATGALRAGSSILIVFPTGFSIPANPVIGLSTGYTNCSATAVSSGSGTTADTLVTATLADNGGTCTVNASTATTLTVTGITNTTTAGNITFSLRTTNDRNPATSGTATIAAATTPTAVTIATTSLSAGARSTWTVGFTTAATNGALRAGSTITITFQPGFTIPATPTFALTGGFGANCVATGVGSPSGTSTNNIVTVTLADNGGACTVAAGTATTLTIAGVTNTTTTGNTTVTLRTSTDVTAATSGTATIAAATTPTAVTIASTSLAAGARATWTVGFTTAATNGALRAGSTITITFQPGFSIPTNPTIALTGGFGANCVATGVGSPSGTSANNVVTVTLADNGGTCTVAAGTATTLTIAGVTNTTTTGNTTVSLRTSTDTTAATSGTATIAGATTPTAVTIASTSLAAGARATWTVGYTTSASGALRAGSTITITFPAGFSIPTNPTIALTGGYGANCVATGVGSPSGTTTNNIVTVTLADSGGTCTVAASTATTLTVAGIINTTATGVMTASVRTSSDTTAGTSGNVTIAAAGTATAVTFSGAQQTAGTTTAWTVGFTTTATGALRAGDTITAQFPADFSVPANPTITLPTGFAFCSATATTTGQTVTITLVNNGGTCALAASSAGTLKIAGITNPAAATIGAANFVVRTAADTGAASPGSSVTIGPAGSPASVSFAASTRQAAATATWTVGYTTTSGGALGPGDTITVKFPSAFTVPSTPTIGLTGGFTTCSATGTTQLSTVTITLANNGGTCAVANSAAVTFTVAGITNGPPATYAASAFTVRSNADSNPSSPGASIDIFGVATALTIVPSTTTPAAGAADNLTITAVDSGGRTVATYTGDHSLTFGGANNSTNPVTTPAVTDKTGAAVNFGTATTITFTNGVATVSGSNNGVMKLYKAESPTVSVSDGTLSGNVSMTVGPATTSRLIVTGSATQTAGAAQATTIKATDPYGNTDTNYTGSHPLTFSGANSSTNPVTAPTVTNSAATAVPFGSSTAITFTAGVSTSGGSMTLYKAEAAQIVATDGLGNTSAGSDRLAVTVSAAAVSKLDVTSVPAGNVTAATNFSVTFASEDAYGNAANVVGNTGVTLNPSGAGTLSNNSGTITAGTNSATLSTVQYTKAESLTLIAHRTSGDALSDSGSSAAITVVAGAFSKLQLLMPGETAAPGTGTGTGKTGSPSAQTAGTSFNVTVSAVDANWNLVNTVTDTAGITSSDANATLPGNAALAAGTKTFSVTAKTAGTATFTATDISDGSKTANTSPSTTINAGAFAKLQILMPGETAAPGTASGKTGSPSAQTAGTSFNVTVNAVDANWNLVNTVTDTAGITSSDANATLPGNAALAAGTKSFSVTAKTAGTATFTATDISDGSKTANTSPSTTINAGAFAKLQILMPGETAAPGTASGKTGSPSAQTAGTSFNVTVNAVDANWNLINTVTDTAGITSSDANAGLPGNAALVAGTKTFAVTAKTAGSATFTATDITDGSKTANTSPATTINAGAFAKLQLLMPGETAAPGTGTGKTGSPSAQTAGTSFNVTVNAVDANWNLVNTVTDTAGITSSDANAALPANAALVAGTKTFAVTAKTAGSATFTATDITDGSKTANTSPATTINAGAFAKLQILMPGETAAPGTASGKTGSPSAQTAGTSFNVTVNAVDANWNLINTVTDTAGITSSDANATLPGNAALAAGTKTFSVTAKTAGSATFTATDISDGSKTANTSPATTINAGAFTKLQILMPGEAAAPGTGTGKTGSPSAQTAGTSFNVTVNAVDANWNVVNTVTDTAGITSSDANATLPANAALVAGTKSFSVTAKTAGSATFTATDITNGAKTPNTSPATTINAGAFAKLQILMPGETAAPGTGTGKTGSPSAQTAGTSFNLTVNAVDANWNLVNTVTDTAGITSSDANATLPGNAALAAGTKTFSVTAKTAGSATFTATDITDGSKTANTSPATTINAGAFTKLQILMPGEAAAPGTGTGKTGSPSAQTAGTSFNVTVNAVDANWNVVSTVTDTAGITSSDANATLPANAALAAGTKTFAVTAKTAGSATFTATDISDGSKTANTSPATTINAGAFTKLQILMPGETAAPGTASGKTGSPSAQTAGSSFNVTVNAVDANWNLINTVTDTGGITSSDANAGLPANAALVAGTKTFAVTAKTAGSATFTATDISDGSKTANTSPATTINAGAFTKLQILMPGETAAPGSGTGKTGSPSAQTAGTGFNVTVNAVDANWNLVNTVTDTGGITSSDANAGLPANAALVAGTKTFAVTAKTAGSATFTATDISDGSKTANTSPATTINAGAFAKLQLLMPGETAAPGTAAGKTGSPSAQTAGTSFNVTVNAVDANWNLINTVTDTAGITSSDANATLPGNAALVAGTKSFSVTAKTAGSATFTATDITDGSKTANTSPATTISAGAFTKLQLLMPGETAAPGTGTGKTGSPSAETAGTSFNVTVNAVDANWNVVNTVTDTAGITSTDANAALPANAALVAGTNTFSVTAKTAGSATFTATDITNGAKTPNTSPATTINAGAFAKLQLLMPGETAAPGTASGKTGSPSAQTAGTSFNVTVNAVDANWNPVSATDTVSLSTSDGNASPPIPAALVAGTKTFSMVLVTAGSSTMTATDQTDGTKTANSSPPTTVNAGAFTKLQLLMPGETAAPGSGTGKTGSPSRADRRHQLQRHRQRGRRQLEPHQHGHRHRRDHLHRRQRNAARERRSGRRHQDLRRHRKDGRQRDLHRDRHHQRRQDPEHESLHHDQRRRVREAPDPDARRDRRPRHRIRQDRIPVGPDRGHELQRHRQRGRRELERRQHGHRHRRDHLHRRQRGPAFERGAGRRHQDLLGHREDGRQRHLHRDRHHRRQQDREHEPGDHDQRRRLREAADPDARRNRRPRHRIGQDRIPEHSDRRHQLQRHRQRGRRQLEPHQHGHRHRRNHQLRRQRDPARQRRSGRRHQDLLGHREDGRQRHLHRDRHHRRQQDREHEPGDHDQRRRLREAPDPDAGRDRGPRHRIGQDRIPERSDRRHELQRHRQRRRRQLEPGQRHRHRRHHLLRRQRDPAVERSTGRRHQDLRGHSDDRRQRDVHRDRHHRRLQDRQHEPGDDDQRRRLREAPDPDAGRDRRPRHRLGQDRLPDALRPPAPAST